MRTSLFTPTHNTKHLLEAYRSIKDQDFDEWVLVPNQGAQIPPEITKDPRVVVREAKNLPPYVGALKRFSCSLCTGDVLIELDHDDLLLPEAIRKVKEAFSDPDMGFVYSNTANFKGDFQKVERYDEKYGWKYRDVEYNGRTLEEHVAFEPYPSAVSRIWYAPNHVRAFRKDVYDKVGGYNENMRVLDDLDLMCRLFKETKFHHIDECLYLYRITGDNAWIKHNKEIQNNVMRIHDQYIVEMAEAWSRRNNLRLLDLGCGRWKKDGYEGVDIENADIVADINDGIPVDTGSCGVIRAYDFMEHIQDKVKLINEIHRCLAHGGYLLSETPSTDGRGAFQDPTHVAFYNEHSFWYYTNERFQRYVPSITARFLTDTLETYEPRENIPYVKAFLTAVKRDDLPGLYGWDRSQFR